jgi:hypothetical protein
MIDSGQNSFKSGSPNIQLLHQPTIQLNPDSEVEDDDEDEPGDMSDTSSHSAPSVNNKRKKKAKTTTKKRAKTVSSTVLQPYFHIFISLLKSNLAPPAVPLTAGEKMEKKKGRMIRATQKVS